VHIGFVTLGCVLGSELSVWSGVTILVSHSLSSPILFLLAHELYLCSSSRSFIYGHVSSLSFGLLFFLCIFTGFNFGLPPSLSFFSEIAMFGSMGASSVLCLLPLGLSSWLGFLYSISFYTRSMGGPFARICFTVTNTWVFLPSGLLSVFLPFSSSGFFVF